MDTSPVEVQALIMAKRKCPARALASGTHVVVLEERPALRWPWRRAATSRLVRMWCGIAEEVR